MKTLNKNEMRKVEGGGTAHCNYCGRNFYDKTSTFLWWTIVWKTGDQSYAQHLRFKKNSGELTCMYAKK